MVMRVVGAAPSWPSAVAHPAEGALQDGLLHLHRDQGGHQAGQRVVDDRGEGGLEKTTGFKPKYGGGGGGGPTLNSAISCSRLMMSCCTQGSLAS